MPPRQGSISPKTRFGTTWAVTMGMVALLLLTGTAVASAEQTPTESVKSTIAEVIQILDNEELKQSGRSVERRQKIEQVVRQRVS